ncbi:hypothetical protein GCM10023115_07420 [Pontixanthobacter gangjinensis]|uniref:diguanylate cyclase n=1 Tax=Pontixanthobacter gangjinensis TaxID=1028742 RepID=A0A6I4SJQ9_9SPHN|nr:GGDEF domain-containing protein [Pontixanthobacter gangjinensis]MXO55989.1 diguanylate cyclase [Pontixanthobacter gangjinensis]
MPCPPSRHSLPEDIDHAIDSGGHPREWSKPLQSAYEDDQRGGIFLETRFLLVVGLVVAISTVLVDVTVSPEIASRGLYLRLVFVVPVILAGLLISKPERAWVATLAMCLSQILFALVVIHLSFQMPVVSANRYLMSAGIILGLSNLLFQFQFWQLACYNIVYFMAQVGIILLQGPDGVAGYFDYISILIGISLGTLAISERVSRLVSRNFLLRLRNELAAEELRATNQLLQELSDRDPLTGLSNRRHFERLFGEIYGTEQPSAPDNIALMMIDIDHFKEFNDNYGHQTGDRCLGAVALVLDHMVGAEGGIVARFGGEEFVVAIPEKNAGHAADLAEQVRQEIEGIPPVERTSRDSNVTVSIGIAQCSGRVCADLDQLIKSADQALYQAKRLGRNRICLAAPVREAAKITA